MTDSMAFLRLFRKSKYQSVPRVTASTGYAKPVPGTERRGKLYVNRNQNIHPPSSEGEQGV